LQIWTQYFEKLKRQQQVPGMMPKICLSEIVSFCDEKLNTFQFEDWQGAKNGLQVENSGYISRISAAVDASLSTIKLAIANKADLLLVHHGLFWGDHSPWVGKRYELIKLLIEHNLAVYSSHLPLDSHSEIGNNAQIGKVLKLRNRSQFFECKGQSLGWMYRHRISRDTLTKRLTQALGHEPVVCPGGPEICQTIGVVSGGVGAEASQAAAEGIDTLITGEGPHWTYALSEDLGINILYGGHYATETFGVKALATCVSRKYKIPWNFLDYPTGL
jgi:dinuclear metal center YbgI/SA1388 family protein